MSNSSGNEGQKQLRSRTLESVADAVDAFGEDHGLLVCYIRRPSQMLSKIPCFTIPEGYHALVLRGGKDMDFSGKGCADDVGNSRSGRATWPAGLHWGVPWLRVRLRHNSFSGILRFLRKLFSPSRSSSWECYKQSSARSDGLCQVVPGTTCARIGLTDFSHYLCTCMYGGSSKK